MRYGEGSRGRATAFSITTITLATITLLVLSCGDGAVEPTPPPAPVATTVTVTPAAAELSALGATTRLSAQVRDQNGRVMAGASVAWSSSNASVATVDGSGLVTAMANGTATITARAGSASGSAAVTVAQSVSAVSVSPAAATLVAFADTVRLVAEATDANGHAVVGAGFSWTSSDTAVARVDDSGLVTGVDEGTATITATSGSASGSASVTVAQSVGTVAITPAADTLVVADTVRLSAEATDANGHAVAGAEFTWASSDTLVAVVDGGGLVTAAAAGEAAITATSSGVTGRAAIVVAARAPTTVAVTPDTVVFTAVGQTMRLAAEVRDQLGRPIEGMAVSWSSGDTLVATVDGAGLVAAAGAGTATVTASVGDATGAAVVTVTQSAASVTVSPAADTIAPGDTLRLAAEAFDDNGHRVRDTEFVWAASDVSVVRVDESGLVTGVSEGTATITATTGDASGIAEITVENPDRAALVALYGATGGPNWVNSDNWLTDSPLDDWYGVWTDPTSGRVTQLQFYQNGLTGKIPPELGELTQLSYLRVDGNNLSGSIPPELGNLRTLEGLLLSRNNLTGRIPPGLEKLVYLTHLELDRNELTGEIPFELGDLSRLSYLSLFDNNLSGSIPPGLGNLRSLKALDLADNDLTGPIPAELGGVTSLLALRFRGNRLEGVVPTTLLGLEHLGSFDFSGNPGLCAPGTPAFVEWSLNVERRPTHGRWASTYAGPFCSESDRIALERLYETAGGANWTRSDMWLTTDVLEEWYGVSTDSLGRVTTLNLTGNGLAGRLSANLGKLARLAEMRIAGNGGLSGRLPASLAQLSLHTLHYTGTGLCAPTSARFRAWLGSIQSHQGTNTECPPLSDREVLEALYHATGGPGWTHNEKWLTDAPLAEWYGVRSSAQDEVSALEMRENNLEGEIPPELGDLGSLRTLDLTSNNLGGEIPAALGDLANLQVLLLESNDLAGRIPPELGNLANLTRMRLGGNRLAGSIPAELGNLANLEMLNAWGNDLSGSIPLELGNLARLWVLSLPNNRLSGSIPPELGQLGGLEVLYLVGNNLSGSIPPELGELGSLRRLYLAENDLSGPIPPLLGRLGNLRHMVVAANNLSGPIPPELGELKSLQYLHLVDNQLTGSIPGELGNLAAVEVLLLTSNNLSGSVPPGFGRLSSLKELSLTNNPAMEGPLPLELTDLGRLEALLAGETKLCVPADAGFAAWLQRVPRTRISPCIEGDPPAAYLTQAVQSREFPVPLVAGERALLRVFVTADSATDEGIPMVRARFYHDGREVHVEEIPAKSDPIPTEVDERSLSKSANAEIPGDLLEPGLEMVIEIDPDGTLDPALGVAWRIPAEGRMPVDVRVMPFLDLTLIPFIWGETHDSSIVNLVGAMAANPETHELFWHTRQLLPISDLRVTAHEPVLSASNNAFRLLAQTEAIRLMEGGAGHYMGMMPWPVTAARGVAPAPGRWSFSIPVADVMAHELGHNMNLRHAPCGPVGATADPSYPYPSGSIGAWGYDFRDGGKLVQSSTPDLMSYCAPRWIGDYGFTNALRYRLFDEGPAGECRRSGCHHQVTHALGRRKSRRRALPGTRLRGRSTARASGLRR